jgi:HAD superfamily hydrolase (TIGR01509 family)
MIGILVDLDGVLWFSEKLHKDAFIEVFKELTVDAHKLVNQTWVFGEPTYQYASRLLKIIGIEKQEQILQDFIVKKRYYADKTDFVPLNTRLIKTLSKMKKTNLKLALVSSSSNLNVSKFLAMSKTLTLFDFVVDSTMVVNPKPSPDCYNYAMHNLGLVPDKCLAIEDSEVGIQSARNANIKLVLKYPGESNENEFYVQLKSEFQKIENND